MSEVLTDYGVCLCFVFLRLMGDGDAEGVTWQTLAHLVIVCLFCLGTQKGRVRLTL